MGLLTMLPPYDDAKKDWGFVIKKLLRDMGVNSGSWQYVIGQFRAIIQDPKLLNRYASDRRVLGGDITRQDTTFAIAVLLCLEVMTLIWSTIYYRDVGSFFLEFAWVLFLWTLLGTMISLTCLLVVYLSSFDATADGGSHRFRGVKKHWVELMWYGFDLHCNATVIPALIIGVSQIGLIPPGVI